MAEAITLGTWLRRERERRGVSLTEISDQTKLSVPLLQGLEADDLSRWPGGIFRRAFARSYALSIGVDPDLVVRRIEEEHPSDDPAPMQNPAAAVAARMSPGSPQSTPQPVAIRRAPGHTRSVAAVFDLLVAGAIGLGCAAAGSGLLWPVLAIAAYHACGVIATGRSPMLALLLDQTEPALPLPAVVVDEPAAVVSRPDRASTPTGNVRTPSGRFRQRRARGARGTRGAQGA